MPQGARLFLNIGLSVDQRAHSVNEPGMCIDSLIQNTGDRTCRSSGRGVCVRVDAAETRCRK